MPSVPRLLKRPGVLLSKLSPNSQHRASNRLLRASHKPWAAKILQRLPIISHLSLVLLVVLGPTHAPYLLAAVFLLTHVVFAATQVRLGFGMLWYVSSIPSTFNRPSLILLHNSSPIAAIFTLERIPKPIGGLFSSVHLVKPPMMTVMATIT